MPSLIEYDFVNDMVGEVALQWDVRSHSGLGESLEQWRRNIRELSEPLTEVLDEASKQVTEQASRSSARNFLSYVLDPGKMDGMSRKGKLDAILSRFQLQTNIATGHTLAEVIQNDATILSKLDSIEDRLSNIDDDVTLAKLNFTDDARFNSSGICLPGTRKELIDDIMDWCGNIEHDWKSQIVLLTAVAGAGKTTVAHTIAHRCYEDEILLSSFFFREGKVTSPSCLWSGVASSLAVKRNSYCHKLTSILKSDPSIPTAGFDE